MRQKNRQILIQITILLLTFMLSKTLFKQEYLFGWINHNYLFFFALGILVILLILFNKNKTSLYLSLSLTLGLFISNFLGKYHRLYNISKISDAMDSQQVASLHKNYGFVFWLILIGISIIIGLVFDSRKKSVS